MTAADPSEDIPFQALLLTGDAGEAFTAAAALLGLGIFGEDSPTDFAARAFGLASRLVARAIGGDGAPGDAELRMEAITLTEEATVAAEAMNFKLPAKPEEISEELLELVEDLIREAALEEHTHDAYLALQGDTDELLLVVVPVTNAAAHVALLESVFERVEAGILHSPLDAVERGASAWWFDTWRPAKPLEEDEFAAGVREQEWSLVDRPRLASGLSFMEALVEDGVAMAALPPRQRHLARQLLESVPGIWQVRERNGQEATLVSIVDASEHPVLEHDDEQDGYGAGAVVIGRLIPLGDGNWLRSPGAAVVPAPDPAWARSLADAVRSTAELELPPAIILEAVLTRIMTGERVPRTVPPARSASEARQTLASLAPLFTEAGIARPVDAAELPEELRSTLPDGPLLDYELDVVVAEWINALNRMSRKGVGGNKSKAGKRRRR
jgi:hypothetical protein